MKKLEKDEEKKEKTLYASINCKKYLPNSSLRYNFMKPNFSTSTVWYILPGQYQVTSYLLTASHQWLLHWNITSRRKAVKMYRTRNKMCKR